MRLNTNKALALGRQLFQRFGDWDAVRAACTLRADGVYDATGLLSEPQPRAPQVVGEGSRDVINPSSHSLHGIKKEEGE